MKPNGFTLIEVLIVVAIIGILSASALPSYRAHVLQSNRIDAQMALSEMAQIFERNFARQGVYPTAVPSINQPDSYNFNLVQSAAANTFTLSAVPKTNQTADECGTLTINQAGVLGATKSSCWR